MPKPIQSPLDVTDRPIVGHDLLVLQQWLGYDNTEMTQALGITPAKWNQLTGERLDQPLDDPTLALLVWAILQFPEQSPLIPYPRVQEVYSVYQRTAEQAASTPGPRLGSKKAFGLLLGKESTSGFRWLSPQTSPKAAHPQTRRLMLTFVNVLRAHHGPGLEQWLARVQLEAAARGIDDLWAQGSWRAPVAKRRAKGAKRTRRPQRQRPSD
jgi:hypothetical protein